MLNRIDNTSKRGWQLKAMTPANRYSKVTEAERSVRFINVGNLEILGDGVLFFPEGREDIQPHWAESSHGTCWRDNELIRRAVRGRTPILSRSRDPRNIGDWPRLFVLIRETRNYSCVWMIVRMSIDVHQLKCTRKVLVSQDKYSVRWISSSAYFVTWTITLFLSAFIKIKWFLLHENNSVVFLLIIVR